MGTDFTSGAAPLLGGGVASATYKPRWHCALLFLVPGAAILTLVGVFLAPQRGPVLEDSWKGQATGPLTSLRAYPTPSYDMVPPVQLNAAPVIGIITGEVIGPLDNPADETHAFRGLTYIAASYVTWVRSAGAQAAPLVHTWSKAKLTYLLKLVNGVVLPGGTGSANYTSKVKFIIEEIAAYNRRGGYLPLWGTCLGFEILGLWAARPEILAGPASTKDRSAANRYEREANLLQEMAVIQRGLSLQFTQAGWASRMFDEAVFPGAHAIQRNLALMNISHNDHENSFPVERWLVNPNTSTLFDVLATSDGGTGRFVAMVAGRPRWLPFFGVQFHPEKPIGEFNPEGNVNHSLPAIEANLHFAIFFVNEARRNNHRFETFKEQAEAVQGFWSNGLYTGYDPSTNSKGFFDASYFFKDDGSTPDPETLALEKREATQLDMISKVQMDFEPKHG